MRHWLPIPSGLQVEQIRTNEEKHHLIIEVSVTLQEASCPQCQQVSRRIHSRYQRQVADLPCFDWQTYWHLSVRRFFCPNPACSQQIFAERLPEVVAPWGRRTQRLAQVQQQIGLLNGGIAGQRLTQLCHLPTSLHTLLRLVRQMPLPSKPTPRVLGVDDWAIAKGHTYGTVLVDLETHAPVDLLPDRSASTLAAWLQAHPGVEIISRDRGGAYAEGSRLGAPQALQVADRWHLFKNLSAAVLEVFEKHRRAFRQLTIETDAELDLFTPVQLDQLCDRQPNQPPPQRQVLRRTARVERYQAVRQRFALGWSISAIARTLHLDRKTVRKYAYAETFPERQPRPPALSVLQPYKAFIVRRWNEGCHNGAQLLNEIRDQGYHGSRSVMAQFVTQLRRLQPQLGPLQSDEPDSAAHLTPRQATWLILQPPDQLTPTGLGRIATLRTLHPQLATAIDLAQAFTHFVRHHAGDQLAAWLTQAKQSDLPAFRRFAKGIDRDFPAVHAGITEIWSNGQVEGHINRVKFLKRQMYGRAHFDLLRLRVLHRT